jgi:hypothetical protein
VWPSQCHRLRRDEAPEGEAGDESAQHDDP